MFFFFLFSFLQQQIFSVFFPSLIISLLPVSSSKASRVWLLLHLHLHRQLRHQRPGSNRRWGAPFQFKLHRWWSETAHLKMVFVPAASADTSPSSTRWSEGTGGAERSLRSVFNDDSIQRIIDRYSRELDASLSSAGKTGTVSYPSAVFVPKERFQPFPLNLFFGQTLKVHTWIQALRFLLRLWSKCLTETWRMEVLLVTDRIRNEHQKIRTAARSGAHLLLQNHSFCFLSGLNL